MKNPGKDHFAEHTSQNGFEKKDVGFDPLEFLVS